MSLRLVAKENEIEIYVPECPKCKQPMRIYHYFYKQLTPDKKDTYVDTEGQSLKQLNDFQFLCPIHRERKYAFHMARSDLRIVNDYDPSQYRMKIETEPGAKVTEKTFKGDAVKKLR